MKTRFLMGLIAIIALATGALVLSRVGSEFKHFGPGLCLLDDLRADPQRFDGQLVHVLCYLHSGVEGAGLYPARNRLSDHPGMLSRNIERSEVHPTSGMPVSYFESPGAVSPLVLIEGRFRKGGFGPKGSLLENEAWVDIQRVWQVSGISVEQPINRALAIRRRAFFPQPLRSPSS